MARKKQGENSGINRRKFLRAGLLGGVAAAVATPRLARAAAALPGARPDPGIIFEWEEVTAADLQQWMASGKQTARKIAEKYLARIEEVDQRGPALGSVIETNPDAYAIADALDRERKARARARPAARHPGPHQRQH